MEASSGVIPESLKTTEPRCRSEFDILIAALPKEVVLTGVRGGGEEGNVKGESGTSIRSQPLVELPPLPLVGRPPISPGKVVLDLKGGLKLSLSDKDEFDDDRSRGSLKAKAIGESTVARLNGTILLTEVSDSQSERVSILRGCREEVDEIDDTDGRCSWCLGA